MPITSLQTLDKTITSGLSTISRSLGVITTQADMLATTVEERAKQHNRIAPVLAEAHAAKKLAAFMSDADTEAMTAYSKLDDKETISLKDLIALKTSETS